MYCLSLFENVCHRLVVVWKESFITCQIKSMFRPNEWMGILVLGDWLQPKYLDINQLKPLENCTL